MKARGETLGVEGSALPAATLACQDIKIQPISRGISYQITQRAIHDTFRIAEEGIQQPFQEGNRAYITRHKAAGCEVVCHVPRGEKD